MYFNGATLIEFYVMFIISYLFFYLLNNHNLLEQILTFSNLSINL
jgi:hypothetical protein